MREYEIMVIYDLALSEADGSDAAVTHLTGLVEQHGGRMVQVEHWGRRRMAYRINKQLDGDYIVVRAEVDPAAINAIQAALRINERVFRWIVVRGDELPPLMPSRPRGMAARGAAPATPAPAAPAPAAPVAPAADTPPAEEQTSEEARGVSPPAEEVVESAVGADVGEAPQASPNA